MEPRILVLLAFASLASAGPISSQQSETQCATQCSSSSKWNYESGTTYLYDYRVDTVTSMSGASEDSAKLTLTATAQLKVLGDCEMALSLRGSRLYHSDSTGQMRPAEGMEEFHRAVEGSPLRFSFQEGRIEHVCPVEGEQTWALNLKKGVLSAFQHQLAGDIKEQNFTETDVAGTCQTEYKVTSDGYYSTSVRKVKDIMSCTDRVNYYRTVMQMVPYHEPSAIQSLPVMKSNHRCDQVIEKGGLLQSSTCQESHVYRPFSNGQSGGATSVEQTLTYKTYQHGVSSAQDSFASRESLVFVHHGSHLSPEQAAQHTEQKLKEICESTEYDVRPESPRLFSELVSAIKGLERQQMEEILSKLKIKSLCPNNNKARTIFLDALPMASTTASVDMMSSLIINKKIPGLQVNAYLTSLALIPSPSADMLRAVKPLLDTLQRQDALLPISSMVNNFCLKNKKCTWFVDDIMAAFEKDINYYCDASSDYKFTKTLLALRAIGNAGHSSRAVPVVNKCLTSVSNPLEIRVAAAEAFRRMPCDADATELWNTYENVELDSELRIAAYLALMRCPSDVTLAKMAISLNTELGEQVGSFVYSHLTNLRETSDPHKQDVARAIDNIEIPSKFASSPLKASTNLEASALINKINTGFVGESNLVWSSDAQLPRSASANLTVELFGQSVNLLDFGGRIEGLDRILKNYFGNYFGIEKTTSEQISGSVYARVFGNEVLFLHSGKSFGVVPADSFTTKLFDMLVNPNVDGTKFSHSSQFLDIGLCIPTIAGLPIHIDVNGSAVVDLLVNGKMQLPSILGNKDKLIEVEGEIRPSAALEITGTMSVDAFVTKTGLRMRNVMHSSTALKGHLKVKDSELVSVELDTPEDQMDVFQASSKFFILHNNEEQEQKMITENRKEFEICSSDKLVDITGVVLCGQVSFPNGSHQTEGPYFPLTGPSSVSLTLRKVDSHSGYKLLAKNVQNKKASLTQISFNTPGSSVNRMILLDLSMNYPGKSINADMVTPWKEASFAGAVVDKKNTKSLSGRLTIDNAHVYSINSELKMSQSKNKMHLKPVVEISKPGMDNVKLDGFVAVETPLKSLDMDLSLSGLQKLPYNVKASVANTKKERSLTASFSNDGGKSQYSISTNNRFLISGKKTTIVSATNSLKVNTPKKEVVSMETKANYKEDKSLKLSGTIDIAKAMKRPASFNLDLVKDTKKRGAKYDVDANIRSSLGNARIDSNVFVKKTGIMSVKTAIDYSIPKVAKNKIILSGKFNDRSTRAYTKYLLKSNIDVKKNPEYNLGLTLGFDHKKKHSEADVEIKYGPNFKDKSKRITLSTVLNRKITNYKNAALNYKIKAQAPEHEIDLVLAGKHTHTPKMVDSDVTFTYGKGKDVTASLLLKNKSAKLASMNGKATLAWPGSAYVLSSKLDQKKAKMTHEILLKGSDGMKHSINTFYKNSNADNHAFSSVFDLQGLKKTTVSGSADFGRKSTMLSGEVKYGKDSYGLSTKAKKSKLPGGFVVVEMFHPERRVVVKVDGEKAKNKYDGSIEASWDADKDKSKKITLGGSVFNKGSKKNLNFGGDVAFTSPFDTFENLAGAFKYVGNEAQHDATGKFNWGGKHKQVTTTLNLKKPVSLRYFEGSVEAKTPFKKMRTISADVSHSWANGLKTVLKGTLNKENAKLVFQGEGTLDNLKASAALASTIKHAEQMSASINHKHGNGNVKSIARVDNNGKIYGFDLSADGSRHGWNMKTKGDLTLRTPESKISNVWDHMHGNENIKSSFSSKFGGKKVNVELTGSHSLSDLRIIDGELKINSPWKAARDVIISLNHKHGFGVIAHKASMVQNGKVEALSSINYARNDGSADFDFNVESPYHEAFNGKWNTKYNAYPITSSAELQWSPRKKATLATSLTAENWDNAAFNVQLTTPVRGYRNVNFKGANRKEGHEMISSFNVDNGKKAIDFEARNNFNGKNKMARVSLTTPFESVKSLDAGLTFDGEATNFDSRADFEMVPLIGKYQGSAKWMYDGDMSGSLRLETPHPDYPFFELSANSKDQGKERHSRVEAKMHPSQVHGLNAVYSFDLPIFFEANTVSSYPEYDNLGMMFQHSHSPSSVSSRGEMRYQRDNKIEAELNGDWTSGSEGSLLVKTPFSGFENNKIAIRHKGDMDDFTSHGEIHAAEKSVVADASFKSGYTTTGMLSLTTPISGMENIKLNIKKKGNAKNFKGDVTLDVNDEKVDADYNHKITNQGFKSGFKLITPRTKPLKLSFEHNGPVDKFTNEMSASYGRKYDVDSVVSVDFSHPDVNGHGTLKYKLGGRRNTARATFNKNGPSNDMSFRGTTGLNDDEINVAGSLKTVAGINGDIQLITPFIGFKNIGMNIAHSGSLNDFKSSADVTYMDNKNINGEFSLTTDGLKLVRLDSKVATPFESFPSAAVTLNHNLDSYGNAISGDASLTTPVYDFGTGSLTYSKRGSLDNLDVAVNAKRDGRQVASFNVANTMRDQNVHSNLNAQVSMYPAMSLKFDHVGDFNDFNTKASADLGNDNVNGEISKKGPINDITVTGSAGYNGEAVEITGTLNTQRAVDVKLDIKTPFNNFNDVGLSVYHTGDFSDFSSSASVEYMDGKTISGKVDTSLGNNIRLATELSTPFQGFELTKMEASGAFDSDINAKASLSTTVNNFGNGEVSFNKIGALDNLVVDGNVLKNNVELGHVKLTHTHSSDEAHCNLNARYADFPEIMLTFDHNGDLKTFNTKASATVGSDNVNGEITKSGPIDDLSVSATAGYNGETAEITGTLNTQRGLDGKISAKTPFNNFNDVGMSVSHTGDSSDFSSSASVEYMDGKTISGKVDASLGNNLRMASELRTPFQGFELTKMEASGAFDSDINAKVSLSTTFNNFGKGEVSFGKSGSIDNLIVDGSILRNNVEQGAFKLTNTQGYDSILTSVSGKYEGLPEMTITLDHNGDLSNFNTKARASLGNMNTVEGEASLTQSGSAVNADAKFTYATESFGSNRGSVALKKDGPIDNFSIKMSGMLNGEESSIRGNMYLGDESTGSLTIATPIEGYTNVGVSFKQTGIPESFTSEGKINVVDGEQYSGRVNFHRNQFSLIEAAVDIYTPIQNAEHTKFEYKHEGRRNSIKCSASLEYGQYKKIIYEMSAASEPKLDFSVSIKTPYEKYEDLMASATIDTEFPRLSIVSKMNLGSGRQASLDGNLDVSRDINGNIALSTPVEGFNNVGLNFEHNGKWKNFKSEGRINYMDNKEISGNVEFKYWRSQFAAELKTPFSGYESTKVELKKSATKTDTTAMSSLTYGNGKVLSTETTVTFKPRPGFSFTVRTPVANYEEMMASASVDNSWPKYELNTKMSAGMNREVTLDALFDATNDITGFVELKTPVEGFRNVGMNIQHTGDSQKFDSEGKVTYMDGKDIVGKVNFYRYKWSRIEATAELHTPCEYAQMTKAEIKYEDNSNSISSTAALEYGNNQKMDGTLKLTYSPSYDAHLTINTPFDALSAVSAQGSLDLNAPSYSAGYSVNLGQKNVYSAIGKLNLYSVKKMDGSLEVVLPIEGIEFTKAEYEHDTNGRRIDGSVSLTYGDSQIISGKLKASSSPNFDATVTVRTPFRGYKKVQGTATYSGDHDKYDASTSLSFGRRHQFSLNSGLDLSVEPYKASVQVATPYNDYRNMELVLTHEGVLNNFHCTGFLTSPLTNDINADAKLQFQSMSNMEASVSLKSSLEGMDELMAEIKNSDVAEEKKTRAVVGWTSGQQIVLEGQLRQQNQWYENKISGDVSLSTPFIAVRNLAVSMEHSGKQDESSQTVGLELNGDKLIDADTTFSMKDKHLASITTRKPMPMKYTVSGSSKDGLTEVDVLANWNMDKIDSNAQLVAALNDQSDSYKTDCSLDIGLEHASRKMGVFHKLTSSNTDTASSGKIYWDSDDASKLSYDMEVKDSNRRGKVVKEGHLIVSLPTRSLKLAGSSSDNQVTKSGDFVFSWDADHQDKQVGVKGTLTRGDRIKGDITLSMPAIRKEIRVDGELMTNNGRILLDTKTDISYSQDSRKTLTLTSKLEDISDYYSHYNYSLSVGVSHPYTNVDIQMNSHLGSSDEKMTVGLNTDYLTSRRQTKTLGLLAEINSLKRQLSLQMTNPISKMEIVGDVYSTSPYKLRMLNKIDDVETFRSDITVDQDKKSVKLSFFEGSNGVAVWAGYPNSTAFRGEVKRISYGNQLTESLLAVRLNTSRLMHTRLHWNPNMVADLQQAIRDRAVVGALKTGEMLAEINSAVEEEIAGKYADLTKALNEELSPLVDELEKEMTQMARTLTSLSRQMKAAYDSNTFYVQDMGPSATEAYMAAQKQLARLTRDYRQASTKITKALRDGLSRMTSYPIQENYSQLVSESQTWINEQAQNVLSALETSLAYAESALEKYHAKISNAKLAAQDAVYNGTYVTYISDSLSKMADIDVSPYVPSMKIPEEYSSAIYSAHDVFNNKIQDLLNAPRLRHIKKGANEVYQQGLWAYQYWQVEKNIHTHAKNIVDILREIIEDELKQYTQEVLELFENPITVWEPEHGEVQAQFKLPVDMARLDEMPDLSPLVDQVAVYIPDASTLDKITQTVSDYWPTEEEEEVTKMFRKYKPSKKMRKAKKGRKYRARNSRN